MASLSDKLSELKSVVAADTEIVTSDHGQQFEDLMQRWTNIDKKLPSAVVLPTTEEGIQKIVQWALKSSVPFVVKSGGHSEWSTIGDDGIIIDLTRYRDVSYDSQSQAASLKGSILSKEVAVKLAEHGRCTALGNGNTVGAIGYFLGGGASITTSTTGYGAQQIIGARLVTASGDLLDITEATHPDLLWALRGAGHFYGLVTQLTIQTLPISVLGNDRGVIWAGMFVFPLERAQEVCKAMGPVMDSAEYSTSGLMMIMAPPPNRNPSLMISARLTGNLADAKDAYKPLYDLNPIAANGGEVPLQNASDARAVLGAKGDFKRFSVVGLHGFDEAAFLKSIDIWKAMVAECPDSMNTMFAFQWDAKFAPATSVECAMSLADVRFWQNNLIWHTDVANRAKVDAYADQCIAAVRSGGNANDPVDFVNGTRTGPVAYRYRGAERLARLKGLKKRWDPEGVFTRQFL